MHDREEDRMQESMLAFELVVLVTAGFFGYLCFGRKKNTKREA